MRTGSKTVHVDERSSFAGSLVTIFAGQGARAAESKTLRDTLPGKSRVGRILLNDNHSQSRLLDMKLADIHQMKRKTETFISHQQKTFIAKMEKRQDTWVREHTRFSNSTNLVLPLGERLEEQIPTCNSHYQKDQECQEVHQDNNGPRDPTAPIDQGENTTLPPITYLTEESENLSKQAPNSETSFLKGLNDLDRRPQMLVGLPPIVHSKRIGFQPSGSIDEVLDDRALKNNKTQLPPKAEAEDGIDGDTNLPNADQEECKMSEIVDKEMDKVTAHSGQTPLFVLSHKLPRIQIREPPARKLRPRPSHQPKVRQKRSRVLSNTFPDPDNPLDDERFLKLHKLLASEVVIDHESREMSALARGLLAAKRFGQNWNRK